MSLFVENLLWQNPSDLSISLTKSYIHFETTENTTPESFTNQQTNRNEWSEIHCIYLMKSQYKLLEENFRTIVFFNCIK